MKFSQLFTKTLKEAPSDETAVNAQLLTRAGFVFKNSSGIYSYLPLGWRVLMKIANIIREEINKIGGQEILMQALVDKKYMEPTERWNLDVGYFAKGIEEKEAGFVLGWSHEEVLTSIASKFISSHKDLPFYAYQIQTKFRHEARAKSGLLRGREFMMKDLYSFHTEQKDLDEYYKKAKDAYLKIFERCGLKAIYTLAAGGIFTDKFTHEFQVVSDVGEDTIYINEDKNEAINKEVLDEKGLKYLGWEKESLVEKKSIEVGNIFDQGTKYSEALGLYFTNENGDKAPVIMGAYGIGLGRLMGTVVETSHDEKGIIWPVSIAPFRVHLIALDEAYEKGIEVYNHLIRDGVEVVYDDREDKMPGEKFADADLLGCPVRIVVSKKTLAQGPDEIMAEVKLRTEKEATVMALSAIPAFVNSLPNSLTR